MNNDQWDAFFKLLFLGMVLGLICIAIFCSGCALTGVWFDSIPKGARNAVNRIQDGPGTCFHKSVQIAKAITEAGGECAIVCYRAHPTLESATFDGEILSPVKNKIHCVVRIFYKSGCEDIDPHDGFVMAGEYLLVYKWTRGSTAQDVLNALEEVR